MSSHNHRLRDRNARVERYLELVDPIDEPAPAHVLGERVLRIRMEVTLQAPALGRDLADGLATLPQQGPEVVGAVDRAGGS